MDRNINIEEGNRLVQDIQTQNKNDYLSGKVTEELSEIIGDLSSIQDKISAVRENVVARRNELINIEYEEQKALAAKKIKEEEI